jgi:hypothetical protein
MTSQDGESVASFAKLSETNYRSWSPNMQALLKRKRVWGHVNGALTSPTDPDKLVDHVKDRDAASGIVWLMLGEDQQSQVLDFMDDPKKMWDELESIHVQKRPSTRFLAYSSLLSIQKVPDESLPALTSRIEKAMQEVKNLRHKTFSIDDLDSDLISMAMIRALPAEYDSFVSSLTLLPQFDFKTLKEAFIIEETNRKAAKHAASVAAAANLVHSPPSASIASTPSPSSGPKHCVFCNMKGHVQSNCYQYRDLKKQAQITALQKEAARLNSHSKTAPGPPSSSSSKPSTSEQAGNVQNSGNGKMQESAGNASITFNDSPSSLCSLSTRWCADTGATSHMTPHRSWFDEYTPHSVPVIVANGTVVQSAGIGTVHFTPVIAGVPSRDVVFHKVLHVPKLHNNLLAVLHLTSKKQFKVVIEGDVMQFMRDGQVVLTASVQAQLAYLDGYTNLTHTHTAHTASLLPLTMDLLHRRLGHISFATLKQLLVSKAVTGLHLEDTSAADPVCEPCIAGKQHRTVNKTASRTSVPLAVVHCDLHGPMPVQSVNGGFKYFIVFVDDATRLWAVYFLRSKGHAPEAFYAFKAVIEKQTGYAIKCLHDDKEGGLSSNAFNAKLREWGITRRFTMRAEPHSNGVAERAIRSIADASTASLYEAHLPGSFWQQAVSTVVHLHNRLPTSANNGITPFQLMYKQKPDASLFRVFGSLAYVHVKKDKRIGFSSHMEKAIFVGYPTQHKGWEFFNPLTKKFIMSDRADFDERVFPGLATYLPEPDAFPSPPATSSTPPTSASFDEDEDTAMHKELHEQVGDPVVDANAPPPLQQPVTPPASPPPEIPLPPPAPIVPAPAPAQRRSERQRVPANVWQNNWYRAGYNPAEHRAPPQPPLPPFIPPNPVPIPPNPGPYRDHSPAVQSSGSEDSDGESAQFISEHVYLTYVEALDYVYSELIQSALSAAVNDDPPRSYAEAMQRPDAGKWHEAAHEEIQSLIRNGTWKLATLPPGRKAIGCRWVFVVKRKSDGSVDRYKARQVAQGFLQRPGFDVFDTYASTLKWPTLCSILARAALEDLEVESVDISNAFLHGEIDTEIYMKQPEGFPQGDPHHVECTC